MMDGWPHNAGGTLLSDLCGRMSLPRLGFKGLGLSSGASGLGLSSGTSGGSSADKELPPSAAGSGGGGTPTNLPQHSAGGGGTPTTLPQHSDGSNHEHGLLVPPLGRLDRSSSLDCSSWLPVSGGGEDCSSKPPPRIMEVDSLFASMPGGRRLSRQHSLPSSRPELVAPMMAGEKPLHGLCAS